MYIVLIAILCAIIGGGLLFWSIKASVPVSTTVERIIISLLMVAILVGGIWVGSAVCATNRRTIFADEYNQLKLYQHTIEASTNEYVRFDYYARVQEWNDKYDTYIELESNPWVNWFLFDPMRYCDKIDFVLNGDLVYAEKAS